LQIRNLDGSQFLALLREDFNARIDALKVEVGVGVFLNIKVDGGGSRSLGVGGHLEFFVAGLLKLSAKEGWREKGDEEKKETHEGRDTHNFPLLAEV